MRSLPRVSAREAITAHVVVGTASGGGESRAAAGASPAAPPPPVVPQVIRHAPYIHRPRVTHPPSACHTSTVHVSGYAHLPMDGREHLLRLLTQGCAPCAHTKLRVAAMSIRIIVGSSTRVACVRPADYVAMGSGGRYGFRIDSELLHGTSGRYVTHPLIYDHGLTHPI